MSNDPSGQDEKVKQQATKTLPFDSSILDRGRDHDRREGAAADVAAADPALGEIVLGFG